MQNALTHKTIQTLQPSTKARRHFDGQGLYVEVAPAGGKYFRFKYRFAGKEKTLALGVFPETTLKEARERRDDARRLLARGVDPASHRAAMNAAARQQADTFEVVAREWHQTMKASWVDSHSSKLIGRLEGHVFPSLGSMPIDSILPSDVLQCMRGIEKRGRIETAHRALNAVSRVFAYAVTTGIATRNPARELHRVLKPAPVRHHPTIIEPKKIGQLLRAIDDYDGAEVTRHALRLAPLLFVRPGELRQAEWEEFSLDDPTPSWHIPAQRMKMRVKHIVPLAPQSIALLRSLHQITGKHRLVFPGVRNKARPMSENTINAALRYMGYAKDEMTGHGFRSMASTILNEQGFPRDAIERQLAHSERDSVRAAYCYADFLPKRREMMQSWADYLDMLKTSFTI